MAGKRKEAGPRFGIAELKPRPLEQAPRLRRNRAGVETGVVRHHLLAARILLHRELPERLVQTVHELSDIVGLGVLEVAGIDHLADPLDELLVVGRADIADACLEERLVGARHEPLVKVEIGQRARDGAQGSDELTTVLAGGLLGAGLGVDLPRNGRQSFIPSLAIEVGFARIHEGLPFLRFLIWRERRAKAPIMEFRESSTNQKRRSIRKTLRNALVEQSSLNSQKMRQRNFFSLLEYSPPCTRVPTYPSQG